jgi:hypothetical protein
MISMEELMQTKFKLLGTTALAAAALVMAPTMASADQALEKRIKALEKAGGMSVTRTKKTMKLVVSGHVNRAVVLADNGTTSGFHHVTTSFSQTRVRWIGTGKINDDVSVMTYIEMGNNNSNSNNQDLGDNGDQDGNALSDRFAEIRLTSKTMGKLYMGQGSTGTDAVSESDLSGTGIISLNGFGNLISGSEVFQSNGAAATGNAAGNVSSHFSNFDGNSRQDRIRYDTPKFGGMQVTTSHSNNDEWGIALRYGASIGGMKIKAAIGHSDRTHTTTDGLTFNHGAVSVLFPQGISLTVGAADQDNEAGGINDTEEWRYAKIGYKFKGSNVGQTRLFADYSNNENRTAAGNDAEYYSFGIVQIVEPLGAELYGVYRQFSLDTTDGTSPDDVTSIAAGMRFKF